VGDDPFAADFECCVSLISRNVKEERMWSSIFIGCNQGLEVRGTEDEGDANDCADYFVI
jgi:hypothetical protein